MYKGASGLLKAELKTSSGEGGAGVAGAEMPRANAGWLGAVGACVASGLVGIAGEGEATSAVGE
jgi:hypothetical protein